jgi:hypothetical protein
MMSPSPEHLRSQDQEHLPPGLSLVELLKKEEQMSNTVHSQGSVTRDAKLLRASHRSATMTVQIAITAQVHARVGSAISLHLQPNS